MENEETDILYEYIDRITVDKIIIPKNDPDGKIFISKLIEAMCLFDEMATSGAFEKTFLFYGNIGGVLLFYGIDRIPIPKYFESIHHLRLLKAQFRFFISKYLEISLRDKKTETRHINYAEPFIFNILRKRRDFFALNIGEITGIENKEFDRFISEITDC